MPDLAEFVTTEEAAEKLGFTVVSVRNLIYKEKTRKHEIWARPADP